MATTMDHTYSVSVKGMLGEKSGSKVLYDKLLKVNAHEQSEDVHLYHLFLYVCRIFCVLVCET